MTALINGIIILIWHSSIHKTWLVYIWLLYTTWNYLVTKYYTYFSYRIWNHYWCHAQGEITSQIFQTNPRLYWLDNAVPALAWCPVSFLSKPVSTAALSLRRPKLIWPGNLFHDPWPLIPLIGSLIRDEEEEMVGEEDCDEDAQEYEWRHEENCRW